MNKQKLKKEEILLDDLKKRVSSLTNKIKETGELDKKEYIGSMLQAYRIEHDVTQEGLAVELGVSRMQVLRWESGRHLPGKMAMMLLRNKGIIGEEDKSLER